MRNSFFNSICWKNSSVFPYTDKCKHFENMFIQMVTSVYREKKKKGFRYIILYWRNNDLLYKLTLAYCLPLCEQSSEKNGFSIIMLALQT